MKRALAFLVVALLVSALAGVLLVNKGKAVYLTDLSPKIIIESPAEDAVYPAGMVPLRLSVLPNYYEDWKIISVEIKIYLDDALVKSISAERSPFEDTELFVGANFKYNGSGVWVEEEGLHSLVAIADVGCWHPVWLGAYPVTASGRSGVVAFTVEVPPKIRVLSPEPVAYDGSEVPLTFTLNKIVSEMVYCLDGGDNLTLTGNATLVGLSGGSHTLVLYATDAAGNAGKSEVLVFDVAFPSSLPVNLIAIAVAVIASAAAVSFGLVAYFLRHKKRRAG